MKNVVYVILAYLVLMNFQCINAQTFSRKSLLKDVRANIKSTNFSVAESALKNALIEHPELSNDTEIIYYSMMVQGKLAEAENRKIFLNNRPDTVKYFAYIYGIYQYGLQIDPLDKKFSKPATTHLIQYRHNLLSAGKYHYTKSHFDEAYKFLMKYLESNHHALLTQDLTYQPDSDTISITKLATFSAFGNKDYKAALDLLTLCITDSTNQSLLEIGAKSSLALGDSLGALAFLRKGWQNNVLDEYFSYSLIDYYRAHHFYENLYNVATVIIDSLGSLADSTRLARMYYIKGMSEVLLKNDDDALTSFRCALNCNASDIRCYHAVGSIFLRKAHDLFDSNTLQPHTKKYQRWKTELNALYNNAAQAFEKVRVLAPDQHNLWLSELRECYYKLNKGKELKKLEKYE
ncbi:MAG: hypothetical protein MJZ20_03935 [Bacteroidaceae bacterium]|nr:hypothetical protein [Bacteroidaceae bacterium]